MSGGSSQQREGAGGGEPVDEERGALSGVSGVRPAERGERSEQAERTERETTPAPPDLSSHASEAWSAYPSARPTSVPGYDVAAHAFASSLQHPALPSLPVDVSIPTRTRASAPAELELRASFLLLHVDGRSSLRQIADLTGIDVGEVLDTFLRLMALGLVALGGTEAASAVPVSGAREKLDDG
jgi:hypothetical protein